MAGIYLHIPFCKQACAYCNFHFSTSLKLKEQVLAAMQRELELQRPYLQDEPVETIYLGGGTPSLLSASEIGRLTGYILEHYPMGELKECTLEANPDDLTPAYLKSLRSTPVSRFSIGVQSFYDTDLSYMHRAHNAQQADYAIKAAQDAGFTNLTIDLIYGTPGLSDAHWLHNLGRVQELQIPHFSAYALTVEEGTALHHAINKKKSQPVIPEQAAGQLELLMQEAARMGYDHYEISNLALPGHYAIHNTHYWMGKTYLGIGPSAHSFNGHARQWNVANNALYATNLLQQGRLIFETETLSPVQQLNEYIMTSLRTMWGCDLQHITARWGSGYTEQIRVQSRKFTERGWLSEAEGKLKLLPAGKLFADGIAAELFMDEEG